MTDEIHRQLQTDLIQLKPILAEAQLARIEQLQLDLWAYRDQQIAAQASVANLEWRLIQFDKHAKGLEAELKRVRRDLVVARKQLAKTQAEVALVRGSTTFRLGRVVMFALWPLRIFVRRSQPLDESLKGTN